MANRPRTSASDWIEAGYELLGLHGPEAVRVETIAAQLGVAKSGFYHRFTDRQALLDAIVDRWQAHATQAYATATAEPDPADRLRAIGYHGLGDDLLRRADSWLLLRNPNDSAKADGTTPVRDRALIWVQAQLEEVGFDADTAARRAYAYWVGYLGMAADLDARAEPATEAELRRMVDDVVGLVVAPQTSLVSS